MEYDVAGNRESNRQNFQYWLNTAKKHAKEGEAELAQDCINKATHHASLAGDNDLMRIIDAERRGVINDAYKNAIPIKLKSAEVLARDCNKDTDGLKFEGYLYTSYSCLNKVIEYSKSLGVDIPKTKILELLDILKQKGLEERCVKDMRALLVVGA